LWGLPGVENQSACLAPSPSPGLNKIDEALTEVLPACRWRQDDFTIKAKQVPPATRLKDHEGPFDLPSGYFNMATENHHFL